MTIEQFRGLKPGDRVRHETQDAVVYRAENEGEHGFVIVFCLGSATHAVIHESECGEWDLVDPVGEAQRVASSRRVISE